MATSSCTILFPDSRLPSRKLSSMSTLQSSKGSSSNHKFISSHGTVFRESLRYSYHQIPSVAASAVSRSPGMESSLEKEETFSTLDSVKVFDLNGKEIMISDLWKDRKAVVAFARHFGCVLCRKRADYLASKKDIMDASGVALALIGPGSINQARVFAEQTKFKGEVYADPTQSSYEALKFAYGVSTTFTPKAGLKIIQLYMEGYRQDWKLSFEKDTVSKGGWQQGGIIVAGPGQSNISYIHKDKEAGDDPDIHDILIACCS